MYALRLDRVVVDNLVLAINLLLECEVALLQLGNLATDVWQYEEAILLEVLREYVVALICKLHRVQLLVDYEIQLVGNLVHTTVVILHKDILNLLELNLDAWLREELDDRLIFWKSLVGTIEQHATLVNLALGEELA